MRVKLEEVCKRIYAGGDVPKDRYSEEKTEDYKVPIFANAEKDEGLYGYTDEAREKELSITVAARGTIGYTVIRREPFLPVVRLITVVPDLEKVSERYLFYALKMCKPQSSGTSIPQLTVPDIKKNTLNLLDIAEQESIANRLDKLNGIIKLRTEVISKMDELIRARFVEMFGDPVKNTKGWEVKRLGELSIQINSGNTPKGGSSVYVDEGIAFFRSQNVWKDHLEMEDIVYISNDTHASMKRSGLKNGDILMTKTGRINTENSSLGRAALYVGEDDKANVNGHVYFIRLKPEVNNKFILRILVSVEYRDLIRRVCVGGIDKRQLNKEHIENFPIICPPDSLIDKYIELVDHIDKSKLLAASQLQIHIYKTLTLL
jgi:hypothetical protein